MEEYLDALEKEIDFVQEAFRDKMLDSVYIGGGTPTTLEPEQLRQTAVTSCEHPLIFPG